MKTPIIERIREYLTHGGTFNPESMEHDKVRDLLIDCRDLFQETHKNLSQAADFVESATITEAQWDWYMPKKWKECLAAISGES